MRFLLLFLSFSPLLCHSQDIGLDHLKKVFQNYQGDLQIPVESEVFLSSLNKKIKSKGSLDISKNKFRLILNGNPGSLLVFDGASLFIQSDLTEKTCFQVKDPKGIQNLQIFFDEEAFFKNFEVREALQKSGFKLYKLKPKIPLEEVDYILLKVTGFIKEIEIFSNEKSSSQKYLLKAPRKKTFKASHFKFQTEGFDVVVK